MASARVSDRDLRGLRALADEGSTAARILVSVDELDRRADDGIRKAGYQGTAAHPGGAHGDADAAAP